MDKDYLILKRAATLASIVAKTSPGIRFNEHMEGDGPTVFANACKLGLEGIVSESQGFHLPFRPLARLAQNEEPGRAGRDTRSGGGLGEMTRRKREITGLANEQNFPHLVELALPPGGFRSVFLEFDAFHRGSRRANTPRSALVFGPVSTQRALNGVVDLVEDERAG